MALPKELMQLLAAVRQGQADDTERCQSCLRDLTAEARAGRITPVTGREDELLQILEIISQTRKANAVLIGPAGAGKTAIAEALSVLMVNGADRLPAHLRGLKVLSLDTARLVAGGGVVGEIEGRVTGLFEYLKRNKVVLFIDELHTLVGAGGREGRGDLAQLLKPYLARGDFKVIAATTAAEYDQIVAGDSAFERRFAPVYLKPLSVRATAKAMQAYARHLGLVVPNGALARLAEKVGCLHRARALPDAGIEVLERAASMARLLGKSIDNRLLDRALFRATRLPVDTDNRLRKLSLHDNASIAEAARRMRELIDRGFRPPLVLEGQSPATSALIADALADALGSQVIELDLNKDEGELFGSKPGYVGYNDRRPIHRLLELPYSVLLVRGALDGLSPEHRLLHDIRRGLIEDTRGRHLPVNVAVIVDPSERRGFGFISTNK